MNDCVFISFEHAGMRGVFAACGSLPDFLKDLSKWPVMDEISEGSAAFFGVVNGDADVEVVDFGGKIV